MNKLFCVSCGHKILNEVKKPKFCPQCGQSLDGLSKASTEQDVDEQPELDVDL